MKFVRTKPNGTWSLLITDPTQVTEELSRNMLNRMVEHIKQDIDLPITSPMYATQMAMQAMKLSFVQKEGAPDYAKAAKEGAILINRVGGYCPQGDSKIVEEIEAEDFPE